MLKRLFVTGWMVLSAAGLAWADDGAFVMPPDMEKLMPADPAFIVAVSSIDELDRQWLAIADMLDEGGERISLLEELAKEIPLMSAYARLDAPVAALLELPDLMAGEEPASVYIIPVNEKFDDRALAEIEAEGAVHFTEGGYLAFSTDPGYRPAGAAPDLARGLPDGFLTLRLDLEKVVGAYRPLAEMGLGAMANAPAVPDSAALAEGAAPPQMSPENVAALQELARSLMDSARRFDLAIAIDGEELALHTGFSTVPGSPLDPGPQPSFEHALQLTRLLPEGGNIVQTMALDQTRQFEVFRDFYAADIARISAEMPPEQGEAYRAWVESYLDSMDLFANPLAASIRVSEGGMSTNMVMECPDAAAARDRFAELFAGLSAAGIGIEMEKMPTGKVAGAEVHSWKVVYDAEKMAELTAQPPNPRLGGTGRMEAEQMVAILRKVTPNVNMAVRGDYLILSADSNPANLAHMIGLAGQRRGAAHPRTAAVAAEAGPACQQVVTGDLMAVLAWITELMEELEEGEFEAIEGNPIPFDAAYTIDGADYGLVWKMDMPAVKRFAEAIRQLEAMEDGPEDEPGEVPEDTE